MMRFSDRICYCNSRQVAHDESADTTTVGSPNGSLMSASETSAAEESLMRVTNITMAAATAATMTLPKSLFLSVEPTIDSPPFIDDEGSPRSRGATRTSCRRRVVPSERYGTTPACHRCLGRRGECALIQINGARKCTAGSQD